jgi:hypothetical protein
MRHETAIFAGAHRLGAQGRYACSGGVVVNNLFLRHPLNAPLLGPTPDFFIHGHNFSRE